MQQQSSDKSENVAPYLTCTGYRVLFYLYPQERLELALLVAFTHDRGGIGLSGVALDRVAQMPMVAAQMLDGLFGAVQRFVMQTPFGQGRTALERLSVFDCRADPTPSGKSYLSWGPVKPHKENLQAFFDGTQATILGTKMVDSLDVHSIEGAV